eukprot:TRINITY_DN33598_c0_g1_i1.p1 TRINITY_DN33598_c0_g1~~TRINITY_DN33598_c0_g1_i1.p1  ORF type:complete len:835 (-),score=81.34 TRINITY_DN33598_c0_g1_i1:34-2424(-)
MNAAALISDNKHNTVTVAFTLPVVPLEQSGELLACPVNANSVPLVQPATASAALAVWTCGSSSHPKTVIYDHNSVLHGCRILNEKCEIDEKSLSLVSSTAVWATIELQLFAPLLEGAAVVLAKLGGQNDPMYIHNLIREETATVCCFSPAFLQRILDAFDTECSSTLCHVVSVGGALPMATVRRFHAALPDTCLHNFYGFSVTGTCCWTTDTVPSAAIAPVGLPQSHTCVVLIADDGSIVSTQQKAGQIWFGGTLQRYCMQDEGENSRFQTVEPYGLLFSSGDVGRWGTHGLEILGRIGRQVQLNGIMVEPRQVETAALGSNLQIKQAACVAVSLGDSYVPVLFVAPALEDTREVKDALAHMLPSDIRPQVFTLDRLPCLPDGKTDYMSLEAEADQKLQETRSSIVDSLGETRMVSQSTAFAQRVLGCGYAFASVSIILHHWLECDDSFCLKTRSTSPWVQYIVRNWFSADFFVMTFVVGGATMDSKMTGSHLAIGKRDVRCLVLFLLMGWPLHKLQAFLQPWDKTWAAQSGHRWYLAMILVARTLLFLEQFCITPGVLTVLLAVVVAIASSPLSLTSPVFGSCVAYAFGLVEAAHACVDANPESFFTVYNRQFLIMTFIYVFFYHYGNDVAREALRLVKHPFVALIALLAMTACSSFCFPYLVTTDGNDYSLLEVILGITVASSMSGLLFACFTRWQPPVLLWIGKRALAAYALHPYLVLSEQPWDPDRVLSAVEGWFPNMPLLTLLLQLLLILTYPLVGIALAGAVFNGVFSVCSFLWNGTHRFLTKFVFRRAI